jgi:hypothetical protein
MYDGTKTMNSLGVSHAYHVYGTGANGFVQICHTNDWDPSCTCVMALLRGALWAEAYEHHLRTGQTINQYLKRLVDQLDK